ncbi:heterokaryon incompatibility protein-domain-containing protein [Colletotrichum navitas]|uniref:Heterokaryon incompatibility protein-domain-containing protein n=1 Tax=Colletotrichum navitas TaxID=681940 RepID=A0AAD8Q315_9PEZI|nr:heterokaryon incompatibility protein-domain-containing protein [Colletotrichum navitas]KAK1594583.1 heterokaryon incompatibility protein-domain-containing protein [Colletotrichum navitas]
MRLLHTTKLKIEEFIGRRSDAVLVREGRDAVPEYTVPRYAILSHTWEEEEVSFQDWQGRMDSTKRKKGYAKILKSCERARQDGYDWIWIDTCCIDKTSSAELSEAINSMFQWYRDSDVCYVYLSDATGTQPVYIEDDWPSAVSRWYSRGWTLQEVIAPAQVRFLRRDWTDVGSKEDHLDAISTITGIDIYALKGGDLSRMSVARRFKWLARRETTRIEDMAYCMLGIFDINMPLLYGEGTKAFIRLQEEIINTTEDQSIFAWAGSKPKVHNKNIWKDFDLILSGYGIIAESPSQFERSASVAMFARPQPSRPHTVVTRHGTRVHLLMGQSVSNDDFMAVLDCQIGSTPGVFAGIDLRRIAKNRFIRLNHTHIFRFARCGLNGEVLIEGFDPTEEQKELVELDSPGISYKDWKLKEVYIAQSNLIPLPPGFWVLPSEQGMSIESVYPPEIWDTAANILQPPVARAKIGAVGLRVRTMSIALVLGYYSNSWYIDQPWCKLCSYSGEDRLSDVFAACEVPSQERSTIHQSRKDYSKLAGLKVSVRRSYVSSVPMNIVQFHVK